MATNPARRAAALLASPPNGCAMSWSASSPLRGLAAPTSHGPLGLLGTRSARSAAQMGVTQTPPHYQDVFDHSRSVMAHPRACWPCSGRDRVSPPAEQAGDDPTVIEFSASADDLADCLAPHAGDLRGHLLRPLAAAGRAGIWLPWWLRWPTTGASRTPVRCGRGGESDLFEPRASGASLSRGGRKRSGCQLRRPATWRTSSSMHMRPALPGPRLSISRAGAVYRFFRGRRRSGAGCYTPGPGRPLRLASRDTGSRPVAARLGTTSALCWPHTSANRQRDGSTCAFLNGNQVMGVAQLGPRPDRRPFLADTAGSSGDR